jgi:hypothetical protein
MAVCSKAMAFYTNAIDICIAATTWNKAGQLLIKQKPHLWI